MQSNSNLKQILQQTETLREQFLTHVDATLNTARDMDGITSLGNNCFAVKFSELAKHKTLSPDFYNTGRQVHELSAKLHSLNSLEAVVTILSNAARDSKFHSLTNGDLNINNHVKTAIQTILNEAA